MELDKEPGRIACWVVPPGKDRWRSPLPHYWFIIAPYQIQILLYTPPFGSCTINFHYCVHKNLSKDKGMTKMKTGEKTCADRNLKLAPNRILLWFGTLDNTVRSKSLPSVSTSWQPVIFQSYFLQLPSLKLTACTCQIGPNWKGNSSDQTPVFQVLWLLVSGGKLYSIHYSVSKLLGAS